MKDWYDSFSDDQEKVAPYADLRLRLDLWVNSVVARNVRTAALRQQPLLRAVTKELTRDRLNDLQQDEVNFLYFALARRTKNDDLFKRTIESISPHIDAITERLRVFTPDDLKQGGLRDIKIFAGISIAIRGPVLTHKGNGKHSLSVQCSIALLYILLARSGE